MNMPASSGAVPDGVYVRFDDGDEEAEDLLRDTLEQEDYQTRVGLRRRAEHMADAAFRAAEEVEAFDRKNPEILAQYLRVKKIERLRTERGRRRSSGAGR